MAKDGFASLCDRFGDRFDPEVLAATIEHWGPRVLRHQPSPSKPILVDVAYGSHERHRLDLFPCDRANAPIVLFIHGGGFVGGDKQVSPPFYSNVGHYFAAHGVLGACMNYRRAPVGGWRAAAEDLEFAVLWLLERADLYGGNPRQLFVLGQSAGACHVATWLFEPTLASEGRQRICAAIMMSGFYEAIAPLAAGPKTYFGEDPAQYAERSPLTHAHRPGIPVLMTVAEHDPADLRRQSQAMAKAVGLQHELVDIAGHNHVSPLMSLGSDDDAVGTRLRGFIDVLARR